MRMRAMRRPSTSKRRASPDLILSRPHNLAFAITGPPSYGWRTSECSLPRRGPNPASSPASWRHEAYGEHPRGRPAPSCRPALEVGLAAVELVGQHVLQIVLQTGDGQALDDVLEEAEHDQAVGHLGGHAARLEVVALLLVDRADGRRVAARHLVLLDLQVRHRVGLCPLGEHEVAI